MADEVDTFYTLIQPLYYCSPIMFFIVLILQGFVPKFDATKRKKRRPAKKKQPEETPAENDPAPEQVNNAEEVQPDKIKSEDEDYTYDEVS